METYFKDTIKHKFLKKKWFICNMWVPPWLALSSNDEILYLFSLLFLVWQHIYGLLVPWLGIEPVAPALGVQSLNHWTTMEVLFVILMLSLILYCDGCYILFHLYILCAYNITKLGCSNVDTHYSDVKFFVVFFIFQFQE